MKIIAIDLDRHTYNMGLLVIQKSNVDHKNNFILSPSISTLEELLNDVRKSKVTLNSFDI